MGLFPSIGDRRCPPLFLPPPARRAPLYEIALVTLLALMIGLALPAYKALGLALLIAYLLFDRFLRRRSCSAFLEEGSAVSVSRRQVFSIP